MLREHLRIPGMGETTARYFRDKLAMRVRARNARHPRAATSSTSLNDERIAQFVGATPAPWVLKPRSSAAAIGIKRIDGISDLWPTLEALGDRRSFFLLEQFVPGDVYHVDSIVWDRTVRLPGGAPLRQAADGGRARGRHLHRRARCRTAPTKNSRSRRSTREVLATFGMVRGVSHTEFIRAHEDGRWYFLETSARVGGAFIVDVIEAATGLNLWREWANIEIAGEERLVPICRPCTVRLRRHRADAGAASRSPTCRATPTRRSCSGFRSTTTPASSSGSADSTRLDELLARYADRFQHEFMAWHPAPDTPSA